MGVIRNIKKYLSGKGDEKLWSNQNPSDSNWTRKAQASLERSYREKERAYLYKADSMSRNLFDEGRYEEAAQLRENAGRVASMYPDTEKYVEEELETAKNIRKKARERARRASGLEGKTSAAIAITGLIVGLFFLSSNLTGNTIGLNQSTGNIFGVVLFGVGLIAGFFWLKWKQGTLYRCNS